MEEQNQAIQTPLQNISLGNINENSPKIHLLNIALTIFLISALIFSLLVIVILIFSPLEKEDNSRAEGEESTATESSGTEDSFEREKEGADARAIDTLTEVRIALLRYYTIKGSMPWDDSLYNCNAGNPPYAMPLASGFTANDCILVLIGEGELKEGFKKSADLRNIYLTQHIDSREIIACYQPISKARQKDPNTIYDITGNNMNQEICKSRAGDKGDNCYWCESNF